MYDQYLVLRPIVTEDLYVIDAPAHTIIRRAAVDVSSLLPTSGTNANGDAPPRNQGFSFDTRSTDDLRLPPLFCERHRQLQYRTQVHVPLTPSPDKLL